MKVLQQLVAIVIVTVIGLCASGPHLCLKRKDLR